MSFPASDEKSLIDAFLADLTNKVLNIRRDMLLEGYRGRMVRRDTPEHFPMQSSDPPSRVLSSPASLVGEFAGRTRHRPGCPVATRPLGR